MDGVGTRSGKPWSYKSVLTVLRNRTYLGQVHFRETWSEASHPPLVETSLFERNHSGGVGAVPRSGR